MPRVGPAFSATAAAAVALACVAAACGCSRDVPAPRHVDTPDLTGKIPAIKSRVAANDRNVARQLVRDLGSGDPAVRFFAIEGLRRLADGQTFGYVHYADDDQRRPAVQKWRQWLDAMEGK